MPSKTDQIQQLSGVPISNSSYNPTFDNGINLVKGAPIADLALPAPKPTNKNILEEWGATGTIIVGGILSNVDYNPDLTGTQRTLIYDQMRKGDATVRAALLAVKLPILSANWYIKPYANEGLDAEVAEFIKGQLFGMDITWTNWLRHCMNYLDYGSMIFEKVYKMTDDGKIGWKKFAPRLTNTIYRWRMPDNVSEGITQIIPTGGIRGIPIWKILAFINEQEGENYEGISLIRPAYQAWYFKNALYKIDAMATERQGLGIPYVKIPPNANDQDRDKINELLSNLRANEEANIQVPVGWEIGFLDTHGTTIKSAKDMILHYDRQITKSVLAQFLELGGGSTGSFALSTDQSDLFMLSLKSIATNIKEVIENGGIKELVDLNFQVEKGHYPTLEYGNIGSTNIEKLSSALLRLSQGGFMTADPEIEQYLRNVLDLPELSDEDMEQMEEEKEMKKKQALEGDILNPDDPKADPKDPKNKDNPNNPKKPTEKEITALETRIKDKLSLVSAKIGMDVRDLRREIATILK